MKAEYKTKARQVLIDFLKGNPNNRFSAREIYDHIKKDAETLNRTTVYRNLDRLCEQGVLVRYKEPNQDAWYYQYSEDHQHCNEHMHAQCSECGKIFHLENEFVDEFEKNIESVFGISINSEKSIIIGKCKDCSDKTE
jgi:Fe2+ or Zn2+ uptake regulation protein